MLDWRRSFHRFLLTVGSVPLRCIAAVQEKTRDRLESWCSVSVRSDFVRAIPVVLPHSGHLSFHDLRPPVRPRSSSRSILNSWDVT